MDFHKLLGKIRELEKPAQKASVVTESVVMERAAKKSLEKKKTDESQALDTDEEIAEVFDADAKVGDKKKTSSGVATKTATGMKHEKTYAKDADDSEDKPKAKKKVKEEMKVGDKKKSATGGTIEKTATGIKHTGGKNYSGKTAEKEEKKNVSEGSMKDMMYKDAQRMSREKFVEKYPGEGGYYDDLKKMDESAKPDFLDIDGDGDKKEPMKKAAADKKKDAPAAKKGMSDKQAKYFGKKAVKESVEQTLSFKDCIKLVRESGGQQQIDPLDKELFSWAQRVASSKFTEGVKQDAFAGLTYERFGGRFALHDVLSENKK